MSLSTVRRFGVVLGMCVAVGAWGAVKAADLKAGDKAPPFTLVGSDGKTYSLEQFKGKQPVVLAWFPKAFTGG
jgi:peroxiredoxin Q/BCP